MKKTHGPSRDLISFAFELQTVHVLIDSAIPLGLIVSEILANAYKYAFPGNRAGEIRIKLSKDGAGFIHLEITDNGTGFPHGMDIHRPTTLGMQIIFGIATHQLRASVEGKNDGGVARSIRFMGNRNEVDRVVPGVIRIPDGETIERRP